MNMMSTNIQLYFHKSNGSIVRLPPKLKKDAFLRGLLSYIPSDEVFKQAILQYGLFDISAIDGNICTTVDGDRHEAIFAPIINQSTLPDLQGGKVYCGILVTNGLPFDESVVKFLIALRPNEAPEQIPVPSSIEPTKSKPSKEVLDSIKTLINLYGIVAETILDSLGDKEIEAVETLEKYLQE